MSYRFGTMMLSACLIAALGCSGGQPPRLSADSTQSTSASADQHGGTDLPDALSRDLDVQSLAADTSISATDALPADADTADPIAPGSDSASDAVADLQADVAPEPEISVFDPSHPQHHSLEYLGYMPAADPDGGSFRIKCDFSHANYDDPIVYPNQAGKSHLHLYFGNTGTRYDSTTTSLRGSGDSTCHGGILNRSGYWIPSLLRPLYDGNGIIRLDSDGHREAAVVLPIAGPEGPDIYYKAAVDNLSSIQPMPAGLRMIAGNAKAKGAQDLAVIRWSCLSWPITAATDFSGHIPACAVGDRVILTVSFPSCWDGKNLDSADHKSHMAYPGSFNWPQSAEIRCPDSHPVPLPIVSYNLAWSVTNETVGPDGTSRDWFLASDMYDLSQNPGGYSAHGDWMLAWDTEVMATFVTHCLRAGRHCADGELGNGWRLHGHQYTGPGPIPPVTHQGMKP